MWVDNFQYTPFYIRFLLRRIRELNNEVGRLKKEYDAAIHVASMFSIREQRLKDENFVLQAENDALREELAQYKHRVDLSDLG